MDEMRVSDIFNQFSDFESSSRMDLFLDKLQKYINGKYTDTKTSPLEQFKSEYYDVIGVKNDKRGSASKRIQRWFKHEVKTISRQEIIGIGFTLANGIDSTDITVADRTVNNREHIVNDLLGVFSYPQLSAHNIVELFYIHGLKKGKSLQQIKQLYEQFSKMPPLIPEASLANENTSYFYNKTKELADDDDLALGEIRKLAGAMTLCSSMLRKKIESDMNCSPHGLDHREHIKIMFYYMFCATTHKPQTISIQQLTNMFNQFVEQNEDSDHCDRYMKDNNIDKMSAYMTPENGFSCNVIAGHKKEDGTSECRLDSLVSAIEDIIGGKSAISREGFILWLLFCGLDRDNVDKVLARRFEPLNDSYFDQYAAIIAGFSLKKKDIVYFDFKNGKEYAVINDAHLRTDNDFALRICVAQYFAKAYRKEMAITFRSRNAFLSEIYQ